MRFFYRDPQIPGIGMRHSRDHKKTTSDSESMHEKLLYVYKQRWLWDVSSPGSQYLGEKSRGFSERSQSPKNPNKPGVGIENFAGIPKIPKNELLYQIPLIIFL